MRRKKVSKSPVSMSAAALVQSRFRQIHLDFHTSEHIPDVGRDFDAEVFASTLEEARVNWVTLFAKCHHGLSYYPTRAGTVHPSLKFDLLGEQIEACRRRGIVTPAYISVRVDENHAKKHPEWIGHLKDNTYWKWGSLQEAGWYNHCMNNPDYVDELEAQTIEVMEWYDVEGLFFDMCYTPNPGCYCPRCYDSMKRRGLDFTSDADHRTHEYLITREYTQRLAKTIRKINKRATLFFNGRMGPSIVNELDVFTHIEVEALPTGGWGYSFFPIHARYGRTLPRPLQGMTARFHKSWADFGGLKTQDQMLYEAGSILATGAVMNVGDQCHPRGVLDKGAYEVIGKTFRHVEACEPWCLKARSVAEIGVLMLSDESVGAGKAEGAGFKGSLNASVDGAGRMLLEMKQQFDLVYPESDLSQYKVLILPDQGSLTPEIKSSLASYCRAGGAVIVSHKATLSEGRFTLPGLPVRYRSPNPSSPCYLDLGEELGKGWPESSYVFYDDSTFVDPHANATSLGHLVSSYFNRQADRFSSHCQTPSDQKTPYPVAVIKGRKAYLAPALFKAYKDHAYSLYKHLLAGVLKRLLPDPMIKAKAPSAMEIAVTEQPKEHRRIVHLVNCQPQRRQIHVEWIEDLYPVHDIELSLRTSCPPTQVYLVPDQEPLDFTMEQGYCKVIVPKVHAHTMVVFEGIPAA